MESKESAADVTQQQVMAKEGMRLQLRNIFSEII
jgi:hypothetical protein